MTPNELTTLIAEPHAREFDEPFKLMIYDRAMVWFSRLARNTVDKDPRRRAEFTRPVYLCMQQADALHAESRETVPSPLFVNGILFDYVGSVDGTGPAIRITSPSALKVFAENKYNKHAFYFSYLGERIQFYLNPGIKKIRVDGLFLNLKKVNECHACSCADCGTEEPIDYWNTDMGIPGDILQLIIQAVEQDLRTGKLLTDTNKDEIQASEG